MWVFPGRTVDSKKHKFKFLWDMYNENSFWMEPFRVYRKVLFTLVASAMTQRAQQLVAASVLLMASLLVLVHFKPFKSKTANRIELVAQAVLSVCMAIASVYFTGRTSEGSDANNVKSTSDAGLVCVCLLSLSLVMYLVGFMVISIRDSRKQKQPLANSNSDIELQETKLIGSDDLADMPEAPSTTALATSTRHVSEVFETSAGEDLVAELRAKDLLLGSKDLLMARLVSAIEETGKPISDSLQSIMNEVRRDS
jgi:hypothetical protein